jgi:hypothetical protein
MPLPSSSIVQNHTKPRAPCQPERTGTAQHHRPNVTRAVLRIRKPRARWLLTRLLTKRAGAKTSYNLVTYSSIEWAPWARIRNKKTILPLCSTRPRLCDANACVLREQHRSSPQSPSRHPETVTVLSMGEVHNQVNECNWDFTSVTTGPLHVCHHSP